MLRIRKRVGWSNQRKKTVLAITARYGSDVIFVRNIRASLLQGVQLQLSAGKGGAVGWLHFEEEQWYVWQEKRLLSSEIRWHVERAQNTLNEGCRHSRNFVTHGQLLHAAQVLGGLKVSISFFSRAGIAYEKPEIFHLISTRASTNGEVIVFVQI